MWTVLAISDFGVKHAMCIFDTQEEAKVWIETKGWVFATCEVIALYQ